MQQRYARTQVNGTELLTRGTVTLKLQWVT